MPRRYVDFPDAMEFLNMVSTLGYFISFVSVIFYLVLFSIQLFQGVYLTTDLVSIRALESLKYGEEHHLPVDSVVILVFLYSIRV